MNRRTADTAELLAVLRARGETLALAESLTGGMLAAIVAGVPGASRTFRGAVVAYATDLKVGLLGVPGPAVRRVGVVSAEVAEAMAVGARALCGATWALSTTGVAGPSPQEGHAAGTVFVGWAGPDGAGSEQLALSGGRDDVRTATCERAVSLLRRTLVEHDRPVGEHPQPGTG